MYEERIAAGLLDRARGHFDLYASGRASLTVLQVAIAQNARDLRVFDEEAAKGLADIAVRLEALEGDKRPAWAQIHELRKALDALRATQSERGAPEPPPALHIVPRVPDEIPEPEPIDEEAMSAAVEEIDALVPPEESAPTGPRRRL